jgi:hypothetical protein
MRISDRRGLRAQPWALFGVILVACLVAACGATATPPPVVTPAPTAMPTPTPNPHLTEPATADAVYLALLKAGLKIESNTAVTGGPGKEPVKRIEASWLGWPLSISEFTTSRSLNQAEGWKAGAKPVKSDRPIAFMGMNILVEFGPSTASGPIHPDAGQLAGAIAMRAGLEGLLSPLTSRTIVAVPGPAMAAGPSASPGATPEVTATP